VGLVAIAYGILAGPIAWSLALFRLYAIASHNCFPGSAPRATALWNAKLVLAAIAGAALVVCIVAGLLSCRSWRDTYGERFDWSPLIQFGEGRSRFLATCGALTSLLFAILMIISLVALFVVPSCGS
jgi:hypothetical protein